MKKITLKQLIKECIEEIDESFDVGGSYLNQSLKKYTDNAAKQEEDICCYCGGSGTDKIALPLFMPAHPERKYEGDLCHSECETELMDNGNLKEVSSEEWIKIGQKPPKQVSQIPVGKQTYDEPTFDNVNQLPLTENNLQSNSVTVLIPGGFKPPHAGHLQLVNTYANHPKVKEVKIMIGPKMRDGITREQSVKVWNLLIRNPKIKITSVKYDNPIQAIYEYVFSLHPNSNELIAMGASSKDDDYKRSVDFVNKVNTIYKTTGTKSGQFVPKGVTSVLLNVNTKPLNYSDRTDGNTGPISATILRKDLHEKNYNNFKTNYVGVPENIIKEIYSVLMNSVTLMETIRKFVGILLKEDNSKKIKNLTIRSKDALVKQRQAELSDKKDKVDVIKNKIKDSIGKDMPTTPDEKKTMDIEKKKDRESLKTAELSVKSAKSNQDAAKKEKDAATKL